MIKYAACGYYYLLATHTSRSEDDDLMGMTGTHELCETPGIGLLQVMLDPVSFETCDTVFATSEYVFGVGNSILAAGVDKNEPCTVHWCMTCGQGFMNGSVETQVKTCTFACAKHVSTDVQTERRDDKCICKRREYDLDDDLLDTKKKLTSQLSRKKACFNASSRYSVLFFFFL